jgi:hypothetical protein
MVDTVAVAEYLVSLNGQVDTTFNAQVENSAFHLSGTTGRAVVTLNVEWSREEAERHLHEYFCSWEADMHFRTAATPRTFKLTGLRMRSGADMWFGPTMMINIVGERARANHRRNHPWLYPKYAEHPLVGALVRRYQAARCGNELLAVTAYFCLSALEQAVPATTPGKGRRDRFCNFFGVHADVRSKLGDLVSSVGTFATARKIDQKHEERDLTSGEIYWIETLLRLLIDRAGRVFAGEPVGAEIAMQDLPPL